ncbi:MAG: hypothetical protein WDO24_00660 [Pseudomonadota bacterium]
MARLAAEASVDLATLYALFPAKPAVLVGLMRRIDRAVLAADQAGPLEGSPRDRLFDVIMRRFDALQPFPRRARGDHPVGRRSARRSRVGRAVPARHGLDARGRRDRVDRPWPARMRIAGLAVVYAGAFRVWLGDDSADLGKTMAALDRGLAQGRALGVGASWRRIRAVPGLARAIASG